MAPRVPLGSILLERGLVTQADLEAAIAEQARTGQVLGAEVHLRRRLILSRLARREPVRQDGDDDRADEDDPLSAAQNAQICGQRSNLMCRGHVGQLTPP